MDSLKELVDAYLDSTPGFFDTMREASAAGDGVALQRAAHSLKTGIVNIGALSFGALCRQLKDVGRSGELEGAEARIGAAAAAYGEVASAQHDHVQML